MKNHWGRWRYNETMMFLELWTAKGGWLYEIDLFRCRTSAQVLDHIIQLHEKSWLTNDDMRDFLEAINDLLHPQSTLCGLGIDRGEIKNIRRTINNVRTRLARYDRGPGPLVITLDEDDELPAF